MSARETQKLKKYIAGRGGGCFAEGTFVTMADGSLRPIEQVSSGDYVVSFDDTGELHAGLVEQVHYHKCESIVDVDFWRGRLRTTPNHWVVNQYSSFVPVGSMTSEDCLVDERDHLRPIKKITDNGEKVPVWNLTVIPHHTYLANGIKVHNGGGGKGGGGSSRTPVESPNTLRSKTIARVIDVISEGEIKGLVKGAQSIFFDDLPLQEPNGTYNYEGVVWDERVGLPDQEYMPGFPQVEQELAVSIQLVHGRRISRTITQGEVDAVAVKIRVPQLTHQNMSNGDLGGTTVTLLLEYRSRGGDWVTDREITISGKNTAPWEGSYRLELPKGGEPWDIGLTRLTADSTQATLQNATYWSTMTAIIDAKMIYPDSAYVGLTVDSEYFGTAIPARGFEVDGLIINVPDNYDPYSREYSGIWLGKFKREWTNNPAWIMYDLLTNPRYGLGRDIFPENIDKFGFYTIAQYCDELVDDGFGGKEPRFTFNGVINTRNEAYNVLTLLAGAFRGMIYFGMGMVMATQDSPADAKRLFTPANVVDGLFTYEGTALKARHTVCLVTWNNPAEGYRPDIEVVDDPELVQLWGWRPNEIAGFGCTSRGQAHRIGKWVLDTEKHEKETVSFSAGLDSADVRPGDVIKIADPHYMGARFGGRLVYVSPDKLVLDNPVAFEAGQKYTISLIMPDNVIATRDIVNPGLETAEIALAASLDSSNMPLVGSVWIISASNLAPRNFRVLAIQETKPNIFAITALFYDPTKYDRVEKDLILEAPPYTTLPTGPLLPPTNLSVVETLYLAGMAHLRSGAIFGWQASPDPRVVAYEVAWTRHDMLPNWTRVGTTSGLNWTFEDTMPEIYHFRVRGADALGRFTQWVEISQALMGIYQTPPDVRNFRIQVFGDMANLTWDRVDFLALERYELRYSQTTDGSVEWNAAQVLIHSIPKDATSVVVQALKGTYYIRAVSVVGVSSIRAALVINTITNVIFNMNVVAEFIQQPDWLGQKEGTQLAGVNLDQLSLKEINEEDYGLISEEVTNTIDYGSITQPATRIEDWNEQVEYSDSGYYYFNPPRENIFDLGGVYTSRLNGVYIGGGYSPSDDFFDINDWFDVEDFFDRVSGNWDVAFEFRITQDDPYAYFDFFDYEDWFGSDTLPKDDWYVKSAVWTDWQPLTNLDVTARAFQFRLRLESSSPFVTPLIAKAWVTVDMPDRMEAIDDRVIASVPGGVRFAFTPPFMEIPAVVVSLQEAVDGDWFRITNKNRTGFNLEVFDKFGNHATRTFDAIIKGYGAQQDYEE